MNDVFGMQNWNPQLPSGTPATPDLSSAIVAAEQTEVKTEQKVNAPEKNDMSKFPVSQDVTGHVADDGETIMQPLAGKTSEQIFHVHNAGVDVKSPELEVQYLCQCRDCQTFVAEARK